MDIDLGRYVNTTELKFVVDFITPCFLGGASSFKVEFRTTSFKSLLRRWWRIVNGTLPPEKLWHNENLLFGSAEKDSNNKPYGKSKIQIKVLDKAKLNFSGTKPYVKTSDGADVALYFGYGAITNKGVKEGYITAGSRCELSMTVPTDKVDEIRKILFCIHLFGTIGSKSKNGFGSIGIIPESFKFEPAKDFPSVVDINKLLSNSKDYPNGIAKDSHGMCAWMTKQTFDSWEECMASMYEVYKDLKEWLKEEKGEKVSQWKKLLGFAAGKERLPSLLSLKIVKKTKDEYYGVFVYMPYIVPLWKGNDFNDAAKYLIDCLDSHSNVLKGFGGRKLEV